MRLFHVVALSALFLSATCLADNRENDGRHPLPTPMMRTVNPETLKAGDIATVSGEFLNISRLAEVYITNGTVDTKVEVVEQKEKTLKFKVPAKIAPGRYNLMVLLSDEEPTLVEEPARFTVVE